MIAPRLVRLEKAVKVMAGGPCSLCHGNPVTLVHVPLAPDGQGSGSEPRILDLDRVTADGRCRICGTKAEQLILSKIARPTSGEEFQCSSIG